MHVSKKILSAVLAALLIALSLFGCKQTEDGGAGVSVESVKLIAGASVGLYDRYAGIVMAQDTVQVQKDENKTLKEVFVKEGDIVSLGTKLFSYDVDALTLSIEQLKLEIEQLENTISSTEERIEELQNESYYASETQQLEYSTEIWRLQNENKESAYNLKLKNAELENLEDSVTNVNVVSPCDGRIQKISEGGTDESGNPTGFITILELGTYRVKGTINELNVNAMSVGMRVIIRSRVDDSVTWSGTVESIDWENPIQAQQNYYYDSPQEGEMTSSSKYPFYISLDSADGLILGQHVYIEPDMGQEEVKEGLWLPSYYLADQNDPFVWAADKKDKLEKRKLTLGEYDEDTDTWQVLGGLTETDYIAFPNETLAEGMAVSYFDESTFGGGEGGENPGFPVEPDKEAGGDFYFEEDLAGEDFTGEAGEDFAEEPMEAVPETAVG